MRVVGSLLGVLLALGAVGCGDERPPVFSPRDAGFGIDCGVPFDPMRGNTDSDGDGTPDFMDDDADNDGLINDFEYQGGNLCFGSDVDGDGIPNWLDIDSDDDGILDADEGAARASPYRVDTDDDGFSDLVEIAGSATLPNNAGSKPPAEDIVLLLPFEGAAETRTIRFRNVVEVADVYFLVDTTGSMREERENVIKAMVDVIVPGIQMAIPNVWFGAGGFDDYPVGEYGGGDDRPYYSLMTMAPGDQDRGSWSIPATFDACPGGGSFGIGTLTSRANGRPDIEDAIAGLPCHGGNDGPEGYVPALWALATGRELRWGSGSSLDVHVPAQTCMLPGGIGYACFRPDSLPIVLMVGDNYFHNGPMGEYPYDAIPMAPRYRDARDALQDIGARVISIYTGSPDGDGNAAYQTLAEDTGAVFPDGSPMVFNVPGDASGIDETVVSAVSMLAAGTVQDVIVEPANGLLNPEEIDARGLVETLVAVEGYARDGTPGPGPMSYERKDGATFFVVQPGASLDYSVTLRNDIVMHEERPRLLTVVLNARAVGGAIFSKRSVYVVVPATTGRVRFDDDGEPM